jgi:hypothetical protein
VKAKYAIAVMFVLMLFALGLVAQTAATPAASDSKAACAGCNHTDDAAMQSCCKDGKGCDMKDAAASAGAAGAGKMACQKDCCQGMKDMAKGKSCCKDGKCEMAKGDKNCCGASCKKNKAS